MTRTDNQLHGAVERAVAFLAEAQLPDGEFKTVLGSEETLADAVWDSSPFVTSLVVCSLGYAAPAANPLIERALSFLLQAMEPGGLWRYYSAKQFKHVRVPPDLDDTACISFALTYYRKTIPDNRWIILSNVDEQGLFRTWLVPTDTSTDLFRHALEKAEQFAEARTPPMPDDHKGRARFSAPKDPLTLDIVDAVVNAHVVLYLGEKAETRAAIEYLVHRIEAARENETGVYYTDPMTLYYAISRACRHTAPSLRRVASLITRRIQERQRADGGFGVPLVTALGVCSLLTFEPHSEALPDAVSFLLRSQETDGSWARATYYRVPGEYWGSTELTTALCVEALSRYQDFCMKGGDDAR